MAFDGNQLGFDPTQLDALDGLDGQIGQVCVDFLLVSFFVCPLFLRLKLPLCWALN
jgi:hypothetical protein